MEMVEATQPIMEPGPPMPADPEPSRFRRVQATIGAHGSREVKDLLAKWISARVMFFIDAESLRAMREREKNLLPGTTTIEALTGKSISQQYQEVDALRKELRSAARAIEDQVNSELRD